MSFVRGPTHVTGRTARDSVTPPGAAQLAAVRYEGGVVSYLEVLYNEQQLFDAELLLAQARRDELLSVVELYRSLGGGWEVSTTNQIAEVSQPSQ